MIELRDLTRRFPGAGWVQAIFLRPARNAAAIGVESALAVEGRGLAGDRSAERLAATVGGSKRQVTLIQAEHLPLIAAWCGRDAVAPADLRRNLVVAGLNLLAARSPFTDQTMRLHVGETVVLDVTGPCAPCSKMEAALGPGGYNALRGHGGVTARVVRGGTLRVGDAVHVAPAQAV